MRAFNTKPLPVLPTRMEAWPSAGTPHCVQSAYPDAGLRTQGPPISYLGCSQGWVPNVGVPSAASSQSTSPVGLPSV